MIEAGELTKKITIQSFTATDGPDGAPIKDWTNLATVWAKVEMLQGKELYLAQQNHPEMTARIKIRYRTGITSKMRVLYGTRIFYVDGEPINVEEGNWGLYLMCKEVQNSGDK